MPVSGRNHGIHDRQYGEAPLPLASALREELLIDRRLALPQFGATLFPAYSAFNLSYAMIYLPGSGIMGAYTDAKTGDVDPQFNQALAIYLWAWFILTFLFSIAAMRSSWVLFLDLVVLCLCLLLLACGNMTNSDGLSTAGYAIGVVVAFLTCTLDSPSTIDPRPRMDTHDC